MGVGDRMDDFGGKVREAGPKEGWRPTGRQMFDRMTKAQQDELLGPDVAEAVRTGKVKLDDLVVEHRMETEDDFIAQATPQDLGIPPRDT